MDGGARLRLINNTAMGFGGGLALAGGALLHVTVVDGVPTAVSRWFDCIDNLAAYGGCLCVYHSQILTQDGSVLLKSNLAAVAGGGLFVSGDSQLSLRGWVIEANAAGQVGGGAVIIMAAQTAPPPPRSIIKNSTIANNTAANRLCTTFVACDRIFKAHGDVELSSDPGMARASGIGGGLVVSGSGVVLT